MDMAARVQRPPLGILLLLVTIAFIAFNSIASVIVHALEPGMVITAEEEHAGLIPKLSTEALDSIARLDDHQVEDSDVARADRMLAALEAIPEDERLHMGLDVEKMRSTPLAERLVKLTHLWGQRQHELKEAYDAMPKVNDLLMARIKVLQSFDSSETDVVVALTDLEDLLSDIDMARDFHSLGGFPLLTSMLNVSRPEAVREAAAWTIGTAVKNLPEHQSWVLQVNHQTEDSALSLLLQNADVAQTPGLRKKLVYSLSACLRNNVDVQLQFGSSRGEAKLSALYDADASDSRLRTKILTLLSDLLQEAARGSPAAALATMPLGSTVKSGGVWCNRVDEALQKASSPVALEKALEAVVSFAPSCGDQFADLNTKQRLGDLAQQCRSSIPAELEGRETEFQEELAKRLEHGITALR